MALNATLWYRAAAWARQARARPDMTLWWSCCGTPSLGAQTSIGRHGARDVLVASCAHCGAEWLSLSQAENPGDWRPMQHGGVAAARPACGPARQPAHAIENILNIEERGAWRRRKRRDAED
ncbi:hypothetical protein SAMN05216567_11865 [Variovorax sp. OK605]|jgi:hypothetical protein|uniref:hypothetical protein n=1 Tax=Variovorax sp. OK605 TaxID=1855317 RepID=UPI0008F2E506|nr:hypothetical protein [Variovorax sp. OK605]SFQ52229.1 hypothetical protein SAMN05216567_11865 [Variovorax sp. OK605]